MEEFFTAKQVHIKVCDFGKRFKVKDDNERDILIGMYYQTAECGCCPPADNLNRFKIFDVRESHLWSLQATPPDDCCGCNGNLASKVVRIGGGVLGELHGSPNAYILNNASGDQLYSLTSGFLSQTYEILPTFNPNCKGKVKKEFTLLNLTSRLDFPECSVELLDHKVLLLVAALEITRRYYEQQQRS